MKILYVAKHDKGQNDNEGAIKYALEVLGHEVHAIHERKFVRRADSFDLLLFQNWRNPPAIANLPFPKVFWYFDRIDYGDDRILDAWTRYRKQWMRSMIPQTDIGFCTDGDWAARHPDKLVHLMQGADERRARFRPAEQSGILFTGQIYGRGEGRKSFVEEMRRVYGDGFRHEMRAFGPRLFDLVSRSAIVVAPDGPVSDRYYSNRPYIMCSLGGFVMHPYCQTIADHYRDGEEIVLYRNREELHEKIAYYMEHPQERLAIAEAGYRRTLAEHLYRHRMEIILDTLNQRGVL